jgi:predicted PurR-regulated permease PerM
MMVCAALLAYAARFALLIALIGIGLGTLLSPWVTAIQRRFRIARGWGGLILLLLIVTCLIASSIALVAFVTSQVDILASKLPEIQVGIQKQLRKVAHLFPGAGQEKTWLGLERFGEQVLRWGVGQVQAAAESLGATVVVIAIALYIAVKPKQYLSAVLSAFPMHQRTRVTEILAASARALRRWFHGEILDMAVVGLMTGLGLLAIGIDSWMFFGFLAGVLDIIPYLGPVIAAMLTLLVALGTEPDKVPWVAALFIAAQQIEGNVFLPLIMREEANLPEVHLIVLMLVFWSWFGILGALIAAPALAIGRTIYLMTYQRKMDLKVDAHSRGEAA